MSFNTGLVSISFRRYSVDEILDACQRAGLSLIEWGSDVHAKKEDLQLLRVIREPSAFVECYLYRTVLPASAVILQEGETVAARFTSLKRFEELMHTDGIAQPVAFRYGVVRDALYDALGMDRG